ncbi:hypothetical protein CC78DRAFT_235477 [Lojkania enalia]|uniref:Uncharacterized protein n=1 Tax=Lojkania enalia TaxID=147567 RepID=A0A9P4N6A7_9PLEO|nr:hypothetical protein CC78DRAFT_235477 [Didymosphaeria enalia]
MRTSFVAFWKGTAMFQFSVVCIFIVPMVYKNENQPDPNIRLVQAAGLLFLSAMPIVTLSYVTTPFVKTVFINLPSTARLSRDSLARFSKRLPPDTLLEFTTLRAFPFQRNTAVMLSELQALKPQWWRFANIERVKTKEFERLQRQKSLWRRLLQIVNEPRFKFYVKEGRNYTIRTGVPGVWENVARAIQKQTVLDGGKEAKEMARLVKEVQIRNIKRQTTRSTR